MDHNGKEYSYTLGSDVDRDGMFIEVSDEPEGTNEIIEVFYSDATHQMTVTLYKPDVPLEVVEWALSVARQQLPPVNKPDN